MQVPGLEQRIQSQAELQHGYQLLHFHRQQQLQWQEQQQQQWHEQQQEQQQPQEAQPLEGMGPASAAPVNLRYQRWYVKHRQQKLEKSRSQSMNKKVAKRLAAAVHAMHQHDSEHNAEATTSQSIGQAAMGASRAAAARFALAQLEDTTTRALATEGYCVVPGSDTFAALTQRLLDAMPPTINAAAHPWENIFNRVPGTRCHLKLPDVGARSPFAAVKKLVMDEVIPLINTTLLGMGDREVTRPAILLSKKTTAERAIAQGPHRDWPTQRSVPAATVFVLVRRLSFRDNVRGGVSTQANRRMCIMHVCAHRVPHVCICWMYISVVHQANVHHARTPHVIMTM
jgi:hypothetical protein